MKPGAPRVLHVHASFAQDRPLAVRAARIMDAFGGRLSHSVVSASGDFGAADTLARGLRIQRQTDFPPLTGLPMPGRLQRIARALQDFDLILTYGRGAIGVALAHTMFSKVHPLPPLIHHEDGSDETARERRGLRSKWLRRVGLGKAAGLVVPTETMEHAALIDWQQPIGRVKSIRDGIDLKRYVRAAKPDAIPRILKRPGEFWLGCLTAPGDEAEAIAALGALEGLAPEWHLVILGGQGEAVRNAVTSRGLDHRVHFAPEGTDRPAALALFDLVAVTARREPFPLAAAEAMAAARPIVAFGGEGEAARNLSPDNGELLASEKPDAALQRLAGDRYLRDAMGKANREKAEAERDEAAMVAAYRRLYSSAIGRDAI